MKEETPSQYPKQVPMAVPIRVPSLCHIHTTFLSVFSAFLHCACDRGYGFSHYNSSWCFHSMQQNCHQGEDQHQRTIELSCHLLQQSTHTVRVLEHVQRRKKQIPYRWETGVWVWVYLRKVDHSDRNHGLNQSDRRQLASISISWLRKCEVPGWKQDFSHLTCFALELAPHQNTVSGCRCWHTG